MRKQKEKTGDLIDEKPFKLNKETRKKTNYLFLLLKRWKTSDILLWKLGGKWNLINNKSEFWLNGLIRTSTSRATKSIAVFILISASFVGSFH